MSVVLFLGSFTLFTRHHDFPYSYHPDESGKAGQIIKGSRNYHHPLLLLSLTDVVSRVAFVPRTPQAIVETGRAVSAALAAGTVVALALLAWRCGGLLAGWGAGLAVALQADLFETAHYLKEDPALAFGLALSLLAAHVWWQVPGRKTLRFLAIACGLAAGGKYVGIIALLFAVPLLLVRHETGLDWRARLRSFAVIFVVTFLACNLPLFAGKIASPLRSIRKEVGGVTGGHRDITRDVPHGEYLGMLRKDVPPAVGALAGVYALALLATARRRTPAEWVTLLLPLGYLAMISWSPKIAGRYLLPVNALLPLLAVLGAAEFARLIFSPDSRWRRVLSGVVLAGLSGWVARAELPLLQISFAGFQHDDPTEVAEWIKAHLPADAIIAEDHRVNLSPDKADGFSTAARVPQKVLDANFAPDLGTVDELLAKGVTHIAVCRQSYGRYFSDETQAQGSGEKEYVKRHNFYERVFRDGELLKEWPRGTISYLQPGIRLYRIAPQKTPRLPPAN
ncbi:MAG: hypothetical protein K8R23_02360 [Chthoniobacter sp.]|nr:hypothetical protein [Chthoniobacter sp.]